MRVRPVLIASSCPITPKNKPNAVLSQGPTLFQGSPHIFAHLLRVFIFRVHSRIANKFEVLLYDTYPTFLASTVALLNLRCQRLASKWLLLLLRVLLTVLLVKWIKWGVRMNNFFCCAVAGVRSGSSCMPHCSSWNRMHKNSIHFYMSVSFSACDDVDVMIL